VTQRPGDPPTTNRRRRKMLVKLAITVLMCGMLYVAADWREVGAKLTTLDGTLLVAALLLFVPQTLVSAWRWRRLIAPWARLSLSDATAHTLIASTWNLIVPSKLGDFSKAALVPLDDPQHRKQVAGCVGVEKGADLAALALATMVGLQFSLPATTVTIVALIATAVVMHRVLQGRGIRLELTACLMGTAVLWLLHLTQIHLFLRAAGVESSFATSLSRVPAALIAGIVPAAFCGIGTRDAALVWLYADVAPPATMAVVGLLTALRYVVPGAAGIPLLWLRRRTESPARRDDRFANRPHSVQPAAS
jgi:hypothetical protein